MSLPLVDSYMLTMTPDVFGPNYETLGADFFDDYFALNPAIKLENNYSAMPDLNLFQSASGDNGPVDTFSASQGDDVRDSSQKEDAGIEMWTQNITTSQGNPIYSESSEIAALSESEIPSLEGIKLDSPHTSTRFPSSFSQSPYDTATFLRTPSGISDTPVKSLTAFSSNSLRNPIRKANSFPKVIRPSHRNNSDIYTNRLESTQLDLSFQSHPGNIRTSASLDFFRTLDNPARGGVENESLPYINGIAQSFASPDFNFETLLPTPISDVQTDRVASEHQAPNNGLFSPTTKFEYSSNRSSPTRTPSGFPARDMPMGFQTAEDSPIWWNHANTVPVAQPSPTAICTNPNRATGSVAVQLQGKLSHVINGPPCLPTSMASGPGFSSDYSFSVGSSMARQYISTESQLQCRTQAKRNDTEVSPMRHRLVRKPRFGPAESDHLSPIPSPELQVRKRKTSKQNKQNKQSMPRTPSLGTSVDFVNYTPEDSQKILTGVAPSGSSKTKARREKEAFEKRRKLSQAAVRAVRAVGGDVTALVEEGFLV